MQKTTWLLLTAALGLAVAAGCKKDNEGKCTLGTTDGCDNGQVCEAQVGSTDPICADPVEVRGQVTDALTTLPIAGALVVAVDANAAARTDVVTTDVMGNYKLPIAVARTAAGAATPDAVTLRVSAAGYQTFPTPPRPALPIDLTKSTKADGTLVVEAANTDVTLYDNGVDAGTVATIKGRVEAAEPSGVLVLAIQGGRSVASAISGSDGAFTLFDVPRNVATTVEGYRANLNVTAAMITPGTAILSDVVLTGVTTGLVAVTGSISIVNAPGGLTTSVILVPDSTFDNTALRGEAPAGLRVAGIGGGGFSIPGVAPGTYVVLAAFENDDLVRDPDVSIGGTSLVRITIAPGAASPVAAGSFKVTEALAVIAPGAMGLDTITTITPKLEWDDDSSEDGYELYLYDQFGELLHENKGIASFMGAGNPSYTVPGTVVLTPGGLYQFRVYSWRSSGNGRTYISSTEDLRGVFQIALP